ncbi:hypothetical protein KI387_030066, partial [Taxus chinensis]
IEEKDDVDIKPEVPIKFKRILKKDYQPHDRKLEATVRRIVKMITEMCYKVVVFERGDLVFVFNFHPKNTYSGYKIGCDMPGKYRVALDSDALEFGGYGRVSHDIDHFTSPEGIPGKPETNFNNRPNSFKIFSPPRTCL